MDDLNDVAFNIYLSKNVIRYFDLICSSIRLLYEHGRYGGTKELPLLEKTLPKRNLVIDL